MTEKKKVERLAEAVHLAVDNAKADNPDVWSRIEELKAVAESTSSASRCAGCSMDARRTLAIMRQA